MKYFCLFVIVLLVLSSLSASDASRRGRRKPKPLKKLCKFRHRIEEPNVPDDWCEGKEEALGSVDTACKGGLFCSLAPMGQTCQTPGNGQVGAGCGGPVDDLCGSGLVCDAGATRRGACRAGGDGSIGAPCGKAVDELCSSDSICQPPKTSGPHTCVAKGTGVTGDPCNIGGLTCASTHVCDTAANKYCQMPWECRPKGNAQPGAGCGRPGDTSCALGRLVCGPTSDGYQKCRPSGDGNIGALCGNVTDRACTGECDGNNDGTLTCRAAGTGEEGAGCAYEGDAECNAGLQCDEGPNGYRACRALGLGEEGDQCAHQCLPNTFEWVGASNQIKLTSGCCVSEDARFMKVKFTRISEIDADENEVQFTNIQSADLDNVGPDKVEFHGTEATQVQLLGPLSHGDVSLGRLNLTMTYIEETGACVEEWYMTSDSLKWSFSVEGWPFASDNNKLRVTVRIVSPGTYHWTETAQDDRFFIKSGGNGAMWGPTHASIVRGGVETLEPVEMSFSDNIGPAVTQKFTLPSGDKIFYDPVATLGEDSVDFSGTYKATAQSVSPSTLSTGAIVGIAVAGAAVVAAAVIALAVAVNRRRRTKRAELHAPLMQGDSLLP